MENMELERWVGEQIERLGELRRLLCSSEKPELEQYLAQAVVRPFFYYRKNGNGNGNSRIVLALQKFKALLARMKQMGFRYTGEGAFEERRFDGMEEFVESNGMVSAPGKDREQNCSGANSQELSVNEDTLILTERSIYGIMYTYY